MSKLKQKSEFNFDAALVLIDKSYFAPSVHCSYYGCLQLMKYSIKKYFGIEYADLKTSILASASKNSHVYIINFIYSELYNKIGVHESRKFKRKINDLKQFRVESDYEDIEINYSYSSKALAKAESIKQDIKKYFNV